MTAFDDDLSIPRAGRDAWAASLPSAFRAAAAWGSAAASRRTAPRRLGKLDGNIRADFRPDRGDLPDDTPAPAPRWRSFRSA